MNHQQWIVAAMFAIDFLETVVRVFRRLDGAVLVLSLPWLLLWYGALVMLLHGGGFW